MKTSRSLILALTLAALPTWSVQGELAWKTDLPKALAQAKAENKMVLINFTGSDWCGWCIKLKKEVFLKPDFAGYAQQNLVLVEIDFPQRKPLSSAIKAANQKLAAQYGIKGYPTVVILNSRGERIETLGYQEGGPKAFIAAMPQPAKRGQAMAPPASAGDGAASPDATVAAETPLFNGAPTAPPPQYQELRLKGISGPPSRRFALINNETLGVGDSAPVRLAGGVVRVRCLEIKDRSVVVQIEGQADKRELKLFNTL
jgi:protein disulfide-isomerase